MFFLPIILFLCVGQSDARINFFNRISPPNAGGTSAVGTSTLGTSAMGGNGHLSGQVTDQPYHASGQRQANTQNQLYGEFQQQYVQQQYVPQQVYQVPQYAASPQYPPQAQYQQPIYHQPTYHEQHVHQQPYQQVYQQQPPETYYNPGHDARHSQSQSHDLYYVQAHNQGNHEVYDNDQHPKQLKERRRAKRASKQSRKQHIAQKVEKTPVENIPVQKTPVKRATHSVKPKLKKTIELLAQDREVLAPKTLDDLRKVRMNFEDLKLYRKTRKNESVGRNRKINE